MEAAKAMFPPLTSRALMDAARRVSRIVQTLSPAGPRLFPAPPEPAYEILPQCLRQGA